jgi:outer membrane protein TolC
VTDYCNLITAQERLEASQQIVKTEQTTQDAAEAQLANGRSTLPDVLNARAATAQAAYDLQAVLGRSTTARVVLRETIGVEPSDATLVAVPISVAKTIDRYGELNMVCDGILRTQVRDGVES